MEQNERRLVEYLFDRQGYNPLIRPVINQADNVTVQFGLALIQLINIVSMARFPSIVNYASTLKLSALTLRATYNH